MILGSKDWLSHLWTRMHKEILEKEILHADETILQVLHEEEKTAATNPPDGFMLQGILTF